MDHWKYRPARDLDVPFRERFKSVRRESSLITVLIALAWSMPLRLYLRLAHGLRTVGRDRLPETPRFVVAANHSSHLDALVLSAILPLRWTGRVHAVAAGDTFFESQGSALFASQCLNALPLWRRKITAHALSELRERLAAEDNVLIIFPEGTRSRDGALGRFKPGIGMLVAGTGLPVVPCRIEGAHCAWPAGRRLPRPGRIEIAVGGPLTFQDVPDNREGWDEVARRLESAVAGLAKGANPDQISRE